MSAPASLSPEENVVPPTSAERLALVERVAAAGVLARSTRLRDLLLHVGRHSILDGQQLREGEIGEAVFGRSANYDTSQDNIVRVNFTELRKRIQQHFDDEGVDEPFRFEIPRGTYALRFYRKVPDAFDRVAEAAGPGPAIENVPPQHAATTAVPVGPTLPTPEGSNPVAPLSGSSEKLSRGNLATLAMAVVAAASIAVALFFYWKAHRLAAELDRWAAQPALAQFWAPFFQDTDPVDIVLADTSAALAQDLVRQQWPLSDYISYNYRDLYAAAPAGAGNEQARRDLRLILGRNTGSISDFRVASEIRALAGPSRTRLQFARDYSPAAVREHNSILLGSRRSNPWTELFEDQLQYRFTTSEDYEQTFVTVLHPKNGEPERFASSSDPSTRIGYSLIAVLPSPGAGGHTLIVAGTDSQATEAAGDILTNERSLEKLVRDAGGGKLDHIQILLRTEKVRGTPIGAKVISWSRNF